MISTGSKSSKIPSLPNTPSQTNQPKSVYLARSWISVPCSSCKKCWSVFAAKPQLRQLPADIINNFVKDHYPGCFPWPPLSLRISWNFSTGVPPAPGHLVSYSEAFLDVPDAFWALLTSTTTPGAEQNHIPSVSPGNPLSFYTQNWSNPHTFILTWKEPHWASSRCLEQSTQFPGHIPVSSRIAWKCNQILQGTRLFPGMSEPKSLHCQLCQHNSLSVVGLGAVKRANNKKDSVLKLQEKNSSLGGFWVLVVAWSLSFQDYLPSHEHYFVINSKQPLSLCNAEETINLIF